ncbi:DUF1214 domain-containing protein [Candidatus Litorirhabdus singularis]|uniref:DUF1214 domain-containing protein n=1 Tax=Candidatus Litorirhabdus singularis TaxID=2518993 RepID=UPI002431783B|nr:DUF1214 domain-containing protein [Candidatus Litorirhabdus singularis]
MIKVSALNYVRAKTALQFDKYYASAGDINRFSHSRNVAGLENRSSKRLNRDTLYSVAIVDISEGAVVEMPEAAGRYMSLQVVNEEGYTNAVFHGGGSYKLDMNQFETSYVWLLVRTLVSPEITNDIEVARVLQDQLAIQSQSDRPYQHPAYDAESFGATTEHLLALGKGLEDNAGAAGSREEVDPIKQLLASAYGFGTLPERESLLLTVNPDLPHTGAYVLTVKDVPVDGFWSLAMYNKDGYFEQNDYGSYGVSDQSAEKNADGSITIHFGGDPQSSNYIPLTDGWNYVVRLYRPLEEILSGDWTFPEVSELHRPRL